MKKTTLLLSFIACALFAGAQTNLLSNPGFENWTSGVPDSWTLSTSGATVTQSTDVASGSSSAQVAATATYWVTQVVAAPTTTFDPATKYEFSLKYKITAGDKTDFRIWHGFITSASGETTTTYYSVPTTAADSTVYYWPFHGPDGKSSTTGYWGYNSSDVSWKEYKYQFNFPAGIKQFSYQMRVYKGATVLIDDVYFGEARTTGVTNPTENNSKFYVSGSELKALNIADGTTVEIFNTLGATVKVAKIESGTVSLDNMSKGLYIVKAGKTTQKISL